MTQVLLMRMTILYGVIVSYQALVEIAPSVNFSLPKVDLVAAVVALRILRFRGILQEALPRLVLVVVAVAVAVTFQGFRFGADVAGRVVRTVVFLVAVAVRSARLQVSTNQVRSGRLNLQCLQAQASSEEVVEYKATLVPLCVLEMVWLL